MASEQSVTTGMTTGVAERYASALFELAKEQNQHTQVERDLVRFQSMLTDSADLRRVVMSPAFSAEQQSKALEAVATRAGITGLAGNFLKVLARNRRLFITSDVIKNFRLIAARARGEVSADVTSAHPLTDAQMQALERPAEGQRGPGYHRSREGRSDFAGRSRCQSRQPHDR